MIRNLRIWLACRRLNRMVAARRKAEAGWMGKKEGGMKEPLSLVQLTECGKVRAAPNGCLEWTGRADRDGYGRVDARVDGIRRRGVMAHRYVYQQEIGAIPKGMFVCHSCDNPKCCNPAHLWLGTNKENQADSSRKGRSRGQDKTHCVNGHEYTPENTHWIPGKVAARWCRACARERARNCKIRRAM